MSSFFHYVNRTGYDHIYNSFSPAHIIIVIGFFLGFAWIARTSRKPGSGKLIDYLYDLVCAEWKRGRQVAALRLPHCLYSFDFHVFCALDAAGAVFDLYGALRGDQLGILFYAETLCLPACDKDRFFCHAYRAGLFCSSAYPEA